jgi:hypothetical protein|tara:strand:- start:261 stop:551 length:291 start_codon:yes stop_codon:yes gene_type:complete
MTENQLIAVLLGLFLAIICETILARKRQSVLADDKSSPSIFLGLIVIGFLGRLLVLAAGAIFGFKSGAYAYDFFMYAFLVGLLAGEVFFFIKVHKK